MKLGKAIKILTLKVLSLTALDPLDIDFPRLPDGKYGTTNCQFCPKKAARWHEKTLAHCCTSCALKIKGWL